MLILEEVEAQSIKNYYQVEYDFDRDFWINLHRVSTVLCHSSLLMFLASTPKEDFFNPK